MKTVELIAFLATDTAPTPPNAVARRLTPPILAGGAVALVALVAWLGLRPLGEAAQTGAFWMKTAYTLTLALAGLLLVERLARPGRRVGRIPLIAALAVAALGVLAAVEMALAGPGQMTALWLGQTWDVCPLRIIALAAPLFVGTTWAMRGLAPTRLAAAGAAAGLFAGAAGATIYGLYCEETAATFVFAWYTLGIALCAGLGGLLGPRLLRW